MPLGVFVPARAEDLSLSFASGVDSAARGSFLVRNNASRYAAFGPGTAGQVLTTGGAGADPTWAAPDVSPAVILAPAASTRNVVQPTGAGVVPLVVKGAVGQTAALFQVQDSSAGVLASFDPTGRLGLGAAATSTQRLLIQLLSSTGIGQIIKGATAQTGDLTQWQDVNANILSSVEAGGVVNAGILDTATNTAPEILRIAHETSGTPAAGFGATLRFRSKSATVSARDLGSLQGVWATATDASRKGRIAAFASDNAADREGWRIESDGAQIIGAWGGGAALALTQLAITAQGATYKPLVLKAAAAQTGDLTQWHDSAGATMASVIADGSMGIGTLSTYRFTVSGAARNTVYMGINTGTGAANDTLLFATVTNAITGSLNLFQMTANTTSAVTAIFANANSTSSSAHCQTDLRVAGASGGDPRSMYTVSGVLNWVQGIDNSVNDNFTLSAGANLGTNDVTRWTTAGVLTSIMTDATTATVTDQLILDHISSGTPGAGFGQALRFKAESSTTNSRDLGALHYEWATATDASRKGRLCIWATDTADREVMRGEASGTAPMIGFLGASSVVRQTAAAAATDLATAITLVNSLRSGLISLGLFA